MTTYTAAITDNLNVSGAIAPGMTYGVNLSGALTIHGSAAQAWIAGVALTELLKLKPQPGANIVYSVTRADVIRIADKISLGFPAALFENVHISSSFQFALGVTLTQAFKIGATQALALTYGLALADELKINGALAVFTGMYFGDTVVIRDTPAQNYVAVVSQSENLLLTDALQNSMTFQMIMSEDIEITDTELVTMLYSGVLTDGVVIRALYVSPDGNYTTWVVNTRTNAVTEYQNWVFSSFASIGRKYIAANNQGLFELDGERDITTNIVATLQNGYMQMGGTRLSGLKGCYIAVSGQGKWLMKLIAGDGREYIYQFTSQPNLMTTKVQVGKGLRSRYFSFILQNIDGQDFNLESLEFVPILSSRRV